MTPNGPISVGEALMASVRVIRLEDDKALLLAAVKAMEQAVKTARIPRNGGTSHYYAAPPIDRALAQAARAISACEGRPEDALDDLSRRLGEAMTVNAP